MCGVAVSMCDLFALCTRNEPLYGLPHILKRYRFYTGTGCGCLHLAKEKTGLTSRVTPEGDMFGIIQRIGTILLRTGRAKDDDNRNAERGCQLRWATVIADEECAALKLCRQLADTGFACNVDNRSFRYVETVQQANKGADLDFLVGRSGSAIPRPSH